MNKQMPFLLVASMSAFAQRPSFDAQTQPPAPDYADEKNWSALPFRTDAADAIPKSETWINDSLKEVDVFYVHPTIYQKGKTWNADLGDKRLNKKVDEKPVHYQASVFNESCRVYAPRYRQAVVDVFYENKSTPDDSHKALEFAYSDIKRAFEYYIEHYNKGRPIIISSHSQGSVHARKLLQEFFDTTNLKNRLVAAYIVGMAINENMYSNLKICENENQTGCFVGWISYKTGHEPDNKFFLGSQSVNPVSWSRDTAWVDKSKSLGTVVLNLNKKHAQSCYTQVTSNPGILWVNTKAPLVRYMKNMHIVDYNLFWYDIRANVKTRISAFWKK
ncbi:MAG: DUF3089 domain-containing protein [Chitinophagales bacterium]|nr:DUF3089 domain-containing protein [Chitinophagales bacterium]